MKRWIWWLLGGIAATALLVVGGTWLYINVIRDDAPEELSLDSLDTAPESTAADGTSVAADTTVAMADTTAGTPATTAVGSGVDGAWQAGSDSVVGYRVKEILFGQDAEAVGRTSAVTGSLTIDGSTVPEAEFTVDMTTITSDQDRRDSQFQGRIMDTAQFPTSAFVLTQPIDFGAVPAEGKDLSATATGDLTLRGTTKSVTFDVVARREGGRIAVNGSIPIVFEQWGIPNPSIGPVTTEDNGVLEFLLVFDPAA